MSGRGLEDATSFLAEDKYGLVAASLLVFVLQEILLSSLADHLVDTYTFDELCSSRISFVLDDYWSWLHHT
jgi:hypothetical protein